MRKHEEHFMIIGLLEKNGIVFPPSCPVFQRFRFLVGPFFRRFKVEDRVQFLDNALHFELSFTSFTLFTSLGFHLDNSIGGSPELCWDIAQGVLKYFELCKVSFLILLHKVPIKQKGF